MPKGHPLPDVTRAAVIAALLTGQGVTEVASAFKLNPSVVSRLRARTHPLLKQEVATKKEIDLEALILEYVRTNLRTLTAQSLETGKPEYILKQSASELAILHGVLADKTFRILSALEPTAERKT